MHARHGKGHTRTTARGRVRALVLPIALVIGVAGCTSGKNPDAANNATPSVQPAPIQPSISHYAGKAAGAGAIGTITQAWNKQVAHFVAKYPKRANAQQKRAFNAALGEAPTSAVTCDLEAPWHCWLGTDSPSRTWMVIGDNSSQWFPAFDAIVRKHPGIRVDIFTSRNCVNSLNADGLLRIGEFGTTAEDVQTCTTMHAAATEFLRTQRPRQLILMGGGLRIGTSRQAQYAEGLKQLIRSAPQRTSVVIVGRVPGWNFVPASCLNEELSNLQACYGRAASNQNIATFFAKVAADMDVTFIDPRTWLCANNICPLFIGDNLVTADGTLLTPNMSETLAPVLYETITAASD